MKKILFIALLLIGFFGHSQAKSKYQRLGKRTTAEIAAIDVSDTSVVYTAFDTTLSMEVINVGAGWVPRMSASSSVDWSNITSIPANLDTDSTDDVTIGGSQTITGYKIHESDIMMENATSIQFQDSQSNDLQRYDFSAQGGGFIITPQTRPTTGDLYVSHDVLSFDATTDLEWEIDGSPIITAANAASNGIGGTGNQNLTEVLTEGNQANSEITEITYLRFSDEDSNSDHWYLDEELDGIYAGDYNFRHGPTSTVSARMYIPSDGVIDQPLHAATKAYVDANTGSGGVSVSGTPVTGQLVRWTDASTLEAVTGMVYTDGNLLMAGAGLESSLGVQNVDDGAGHTGGLLEMVSSGWGEASIDFGGNPIWRATSGYSRFMNYNFGIQFMNSSNQPYLTLLNADNTATFLGDVTAPEFIGGGSGLTGVPTLANANQTIADATTREVNTTGSGTISFFQTGTELLRIGNNNDDAVYIEALEALSGTLDSYSPIVVPPDAYDATSWNGSDQVPTKDAVRDRIESISAGTNSLVDEDVVATSYTPTDADVFKLKYINDDATVPVSEPTGSFSDGDYITFVQDSTGVLEFDFKDIRKNVNYRTTAEGAIVTAHYTGTGWAFLCGACETYTPSVPSSNLYTLANAANPDNEVNDTTGTFTDGTDWIITSVTTTPTNGTYALSFEKNVAAGVAASGYILLTGLTPGVPHTLTFDARVSTPTNSNNNYIRTSGAYAADWSVTEQIEIDYNATMQPYSMTITPVGTTGRVQVSSSTVGVNVLGTTILTDNWAISN